MSEYSFDANDAMTLTPSDIAKQEKLAKETAIEPTGRCKHFNITRHRPYDGKGDCHDCDEMIYLNGRLDG